VQVRKVSKALTMKERIQPQEYIRVVTPKGQVTIPKPIRDLLGIGPYEAVAFHVEDGRVELRQPMTLETAYGAVKPLEQPADLEKQIQFAQKEHAQAAVKELE
jgi:AbrB family looped-hinge helix DNA binding protein